MAWQGLQDHRVDRRAVCVSPCSTHECSTPEAGAQLGSWQAPGMKCGSAVLPILASLMKRREARCLASPSLLGVAPGPVWVSRCAWSSSISGLVRFYGAADILCNLIGTRLVIRSFLKSVLKVGYKLYINRRMGSFTLNYTLRGIAGVGSWAWWAFERRSACLYLRSY